MQAASRAVGTLGLASVSRLGGAQRGQEFLPDGLVGLRLEHREQAQQFERTDARDGFGDFLQGGAVEFGALQDL